MNHDSPSDFMSSRSSNAIADTVFTTSSKSAHPTTYLNYRSAIIEVPQLNAGPHNHPKELQFGAASSTAYIQTTPQRPIPIQASTDEPRRLSIRPVTPEDGVPPSPSLVVEDSPLNPSPTKGTGLRPKSKTINPNKPGANDSVSPTKSHDGSSRQIQTRIPGGELEDPFVANNVQISSSGTAYTAGSKAGEMAKRKTKQEDETPREPTLAVAPQIRIAQTLDKSDGSVFTSDNRNSSQRVRSMYDIGVEYQESNTQRPGSAISCISHVSESIESNGDYGQSGLTPRIARTANGSAVSLRSPSVMSNHSRVSRGPGEAAGGAEDWNDVVPADVDRYGFIRNRSLRSKHSSLASAPSSGTPDVTSRQRQYTPLPAIDERAPQSRHGSGTLERRLSSVLSIPVRNTNTSQSLSPPTTRSPRSRISTFDFLRSPRTRQKHLMAEASRILAPSSGITYSNSSPEMLDYIDPARTRLEITRVAKWEKMAQSLRSSQSGKNIGAGTLFRFNATDSKVISRTWKGVPDRWRATAWHAFLEASATRHSPSRRPSPSEDELIARFHALQDLDCHDDVQIDIDMPRTIGQHVMFRKRYRGGQRLLFRVLHALALYFPEIGYVQGMAALVATLICYFDEERAFVMAVWMWQYRGIAWLYREGFGGLMSALDEFERGWMALGDGGAVKQKLETLGVGPMVWGAKWYLTLFNYSLPFQAQLRVWDVFMLLGDSPSSPIPTTPKQQQEMRQTEKMTAPSSGLDLKKPNLDVLHAVAVALLLAQRERLLNAEFEVAMEGLTAMVPVLGEAREDSLMRVVRGVLSEAERTASRGRR